MSGRNRGELRDRLGLHDLDSGPDTNIGGVAFTNDTGGKVKGTSTIRGTTYTIVGIGCALAGLPSEGDNSDFTGSVVVSSPTATIQYSES